MKWDHIRRQKALEKELAAVERKERKLEEAAQTARDPGWKTQLESRIPEKVYSGLESAFVKGFSLVFQQGRSLIERSCGTETIRADFEVRDFAARRKGGRKELRQMAAGARRKDFQNLTVTTLEGIGLGALGVGMPDIVLFLGNLLKGIYETALNYGFSFDEPREQMLILLMMQTALTTGESRSAKNTEVEEVLRQEPEEVSEEMLQNRLRETASAFAMDMLLLKFIQGLPVVGILGGAANPVYYSRVMKYVQLKYRKRYLLDRYTQLCKEAESR